MKKRKRACRHPIGSLELIAADCTKRELRGVVRCLVCGVDTELRASHFWQPPSIVGVERKTPRTGRAS